MARSSFSQHNMFVNCQRWWFYSYLKKIPVYQDTCYMDAGTVIHHVLQKYYDKVFVEIEPLKEYFNQEWTKYKLDDTKLTTKRVAYWDMVLNGIKLNKSFTSTEMKLFFPEEIVAYIDVVDTANDEIGDWKSSTRSKENEDEYRQQLMVYAWLYKRKFGRIPKKAIVYYLKYIGTKGKMVFEFNEDDIASIEQWFHIVQKQMEAVRVKGVAPDRCKRCHHFCPYKDVCFAKEKELDFTIHFKGNFLYIGGDISPMLHKGIDNKFSYELKNAHFIKKAMPMANTTVRFWNPKHHQLPIGFLEGIKKTLSDYADYKKIKLNLKYEDEREFDDTKIDMPDKLIGKTLRDYQDDAVDTILKKQFGIVEIGTGGGKGLIISEIIRKLNVNTLLVVDKRELLKQLQGVLETTLGVEIGIIGFGEEDMTKNITVATVQTLSKHLKKYEPFLKKIRMLLTDETHHTSARSYQRLSNYLKNTQFRYGFSGTARRTDGNDMAIWAVTGYIEYQMNAEKLISEGWLMKPNIIFVKDYMSKESIKVLEEESKTGLINETDNYANFYQTFIAENKERNELIQNYVKWSDSSKILILVKLVEHGRVLEEAIGGSVYLHGDVVKKRRMEIFKNFVNGKLRVLIGTISIFSEGLDIPALRTIINASANKSDIKSIQTLGRVLRKQDGKTVATYIDFMDESRFFRKASYSRVTAFRDERHSVSIIESKDLYTN